MNKPRTLFIGRKRIVVVSLFSGMDIFLLGILQSIPGALPAYAIEKNFWISQLHRSKFKHPDGTPVMEDVIKITPEEYRYKKNHRDEKGKLDMADEVGIIGGQHFRTKLIQEINGADIRARVEAMYGKDIIIIVIGGPPCQGYSKLNIHNNYNTNDPRNSLVFEYLRILRQVSESGNAAGASGVIGAMEEVPDFGPGKYKEIYDAFLEEAKKLSFQIGEELMCSLHYQGHQNRWRRVMLFSDNCFNTLPVFPEKNTANAKRVRDFLDIDYFVMGGFDQLMRHSGHFMQTVTRGNPDKFYKDDIERAPTIDELLLCQGVEKGEYPIPPNIPVHQVKLAIGNGVCKHVACALGKAILEKILCMKPDGDGFFIPIGGLPDGPDNTAIDVMSDGQAHGEDEPVVNTAAPVIEVGDAGIATAVDAPEQNVVEEDLLTGTDTSLVDEPTLTPANPVPVYETSIKTGNPTPRTQPVTVDALPATAAVKGPFKSLVSGYVLYQGPSEINGEEIVAILTLTSQNSKTGNMAQLSILTAGMDPLEAIKTGYDEAICGSCILRQSKHGACYVEVGKTPAIIWKAWRNGAYPDMPVQDYIELTGMAIRFGSYGDPAALPVRIFNELTKYVHNFTGYTHQWRNEKASGLKSICMASVENEAEALEAISTGWRTYRIIKPDGQLMAGEIMCPNTTRGVQCVKCQLCRGTSHPAKNIAIEAHGTFKNRLNPVSPTIPVKPVAGDGSLPPLRNVCVTNGQSQKVPAPKIISSLSLMQMQFESLNFEGRWNEFLGFPALNFHCVIHGLPGSGKSTLAIQLASYVADGFGRSIYISSEEGFVKSFQDKFLLTGAASPLLDVADLRSADEIIREVPVNVYHFIFIDSLDTMKISAGKLKEIRRRYANSALITIAQSTKGGQMRGSQQLAHDGDITIMVTDGVAETTKNRFKEKGTTYEIFQK